MAGLHIFRVRENRLNVSTTEREVVVAVIQFIEDQF
jgi:hypothetical protein